MGASEMTVHVIRRYRVQQEPRARRGEHSDTVNRCGCRVLLQVLVLVQG